MCFSNSISVDPCLERFSLSHFICFSYAQGIKKQVGPDGPKLINRKISRKENGELEEKEVVHDFNIHVRPYPRATPPEAFLKETYADLSMHGFDTSARAKTLSSESTWAFNFVLEQGWEHRKQNFSFVRHFPKCSQWLTRPTKSSHWFNLEHGVLSAGKGKVTRKKSPDVQYKTLKHDSLHNLFTDMEMHLSIPKSWK